MSGARALCRVGVSTLHREANTDSECVSELLFGEHCSVDSQAAGWARIRTLHDDYSGAVRLADLAFLPPQDDRHDNRHDPTRQGLDIHAHTAGRTHRVNERATLVFARADLKSRVLLRLPLNAMVQLDDEDVGSFAHLLLPASDGLPTEGWIWRQHCRSEDHAIAGSLADAARQHYAGAPYRWGGRTPDGADCSGLVQGTARTLGIALPRDSGPQERFIRQVVAFEQRQPSDLVFWPGHVAILVDSDTVFHATAFHLSAVVEPLDRVIARAGHPTSIHRLTTESAVPGAATGSS